MRFDTCPGAARPCLLLKAMGYLLSSCSLNPPPCSNLSAHAMTAQVSEDPVLLLADGFLTPRECAAVRELGGPQLKRSKVSAGKRRGERAVERPTPAADRRQSHRDFNLLLRSTAVCLHRLQLIAPVLSACCLHFNRGQLQGNLVMISTQLSSKRPEAGSPSLLQETRRRCAQAGACSALDPLLSTPWHASWTTESSG